MSAARLRAAGDLARRFRAGRSFVTSARQLKQSPNPAEIPESEKTIQKVEDHGKEVLPQAPNRVGVWSRSQRPRETAMTGPRFEQTDFGLQPAPYSAMELVHKQPVHWTHKRIVVCDGGGGPTGHPRIFINTDKPEICTCGYCGLPFANEHHREHLEKLPQTSYPLA